jgi:hypothetical protein
MKLTLFNSVTKLLNLFNPFSNREAKQIPVGSNLDKSEREKQDAETIQTEPLRMLDVPCANSSVEANSWVIVNQSNPKVFTNKKGMQRWSSYQKEAFVMQQSDAINCAQKLKRTGEKVALIRNNMESWEWLMLVTEWPAGTSLIDS